MTDEDIDQAKKLAAQFSVKKELEKLTCKNSILIGIGSGSTAIYAVEEIARICTEKNINFLLTATSYQAKAVIFDNNLQDKYRDNIDLVIDGVDEIDENFFSIKGGGGCHTVEKILAANSKRFVVVADSRKISKQLGDFYKQGIPIEVIPCSFRAILKKIVEKFGGQCLLREAKNKQGPVITDNGNFLIDWKIEKPEIDWSCLEMEIKSLAGVVEVGLFNASLVSAVYYCDINTKKTIKLEPVNNLINK